MNWRRGFLLLGLVSVLAGCGGHYTQDELREGVELTVDDPEDLVVTAQLISFDDLPGFIQLSEEVSRSFARSIAIDPGSDGYDVIVAYVTGPYCGKVPAVAVFSDDSSIVVDVESKRTGACDAKEYTEAIGLNFTTARNERPVTVQHR